MLCWRGLFSQQISAQSLTAAAGMKLRTPRRRGDAFSQVRAAPGRPKTPTGTTPAHPHPLFPTPTPMRPSVRLSISRVSDCSDIRLSQAASGCEELTAAGQKRLTRPQPSPSRLNFTSEAARKSPGFLHLLHRAGFFGRSLRRSGGGGGDATLEGEAAGGRCPHFIR